MTPANRLFTRVLVPLDGSSTAEFAIRFGLDLAVRHEAELVLLYLRHLDLPPEPVEVDAVEGDHPLGTSDAYLERLHREIRADGVTVQTHVVGTRDLRGALTNFIEAERISAVVLSTQGRTSLLRWLFGTAVEQALAAFPVPLLLVRPVYQHIIVPLDGSGWSESALPRGSEIARLHDAELVLLHVYQPKGGDYAGEWALAGHQQIADQSLEHMRDHLGALRNRLRAEGLRAREVIIRGGSPAQAICDFVESEDGISLVVMSTHGRAGLSRWLVGSVAQTVIKNARCPVVLVHPDR